MAHFDLKTVFCPPQRIITDLQAFGSTDCGSKQMLCLTIVKMKAVHDQTVIYPPKSKIRNGTVPAGNMCLESFCFGCDVMELGEEEI